MPENKRITSMFFLVKAIIALAKFPFRIISSDPKHDHRALSKRLNRSGDAYDITISKGDDGESLWINRRK